MMTTEDFKKQGKRNKAKGQRFELSVRKDLEKKDFIVSKWLNNVDLEKGELIHAKNKFRGVNVPMMLGAGFPDFIVFTKCDSETGVEGIEGIEVKLNGYLDKVEKEKCEWLLENNIFGNITIASKGVARGQIIYKKFEVKKNDD